MATKVAGIESTFHRLRHFYASSLISAGCSIIAVQHALGHAAASTTLDIYGHLMPSDTDRIRIAVDLAFENAEDSLRTPNSVSDR
jgi:integrase